MTDPVTLKAIDLAPAWLNTSLASAADEERPALYRTVLVEWFDTGVRLMATDSFIMLSAWVPPSPSGEETGARPIEPAIDEAPVHRCVVMDHDRRMVALMKHMHGQARAAAKAKAIIRPEITISMASVEDPDVPTLDPSFDRERFIVQTENERLALPLYEGEFPNWRAIVNSIETEASDKTAFSAEVIGRFGALRDLSGPLVFNYSGPTGPVLVTGSYTELHLPMFGAVMPYAL